jgi:drug/metabolite transporter (DMT)-like permease
MPSFALALAAAIWGVSFVVVKDAYADISPVLLLTLRFGLAALILPLAVARRFFGAKPPAGLVRGGLLTGVFVGLGMILQMLGLRETSAANAGFLTSLYIVLVPFVTFFVYQSRLEWREVMAIVLAAAGIGLLSLAPGSDGPGAAAPWTFNRGDLLTIASSVLFAFQVVLVQRTASIAAANADVWTAWLQVATTAAICGLAVGLGVDGETYLKPTARLAWALGFTTLGATVLAFLLQAWGQKHTTAMRAALLFATEPVFAGLASTLFLGEVWTPRRLWGALLILAAILAAELKPRPQSEHISS